jgi:hypothetical protein
MRVRSLFLLLAQPELERLSLHGKTIQSIPFKNAVDVASNGERFTLASAANLKTTF